MRIAMIGTKGVPAKWGGIEKYIEEVGQRLVARGHEVTVFGSNWFLRGYRENTYKGMKIRRVPTIHLQATDAVTNAFFSVLPMLSSDYEIVHFHGFGSYFLIPLVKKLGKATVVTVHAMESNWSNSKYSSFGQNVLKRAFRIGVNHADRVTAVAEHLRTNILTNYGRESIVLPSGLDTVTSRPPSLIRSKYGLQGGDYLLFLGRIDPIKRVDWLVDLATVLEDDCRVVIAGGAQDSPTQTYLRSLRQKADKNSRVIFTGPVFGVEKSELLSNCLLFLAPSENEGLPITVLEAMAFGRCCVASDLPAHNAVIEDDVTGFLFSRDEKTHFIDSIRRLLGHRKKLMTIGEAARRKGQLRFNWNRTVEETERLYHGVLGETRPAAPKSF